MKHIEQLAINGIFHSAKISCKNRIKITIELNDDVFIRKEKLKYANI